MLCRAKLVVLGLAEVALAIALWQRGRVEDPLRWSDPVGWLRSATVEDALIEVGRIAVLGLVAWMVLATALALVAGVVDRVTGTTRWFARVAPVVPGFVATMVAAALVTTVPAFAQSHAPVAPIGPVRDGRAAVPVVTAPAPVPSTFPPSPAPSPPAAPPLAPGPEATPDASLTVHVVTTGESLWSIARDRVGDDPDVLGRSWRALCEANRATLPSGDVNVIRPGDTVVLP